ncbi:MAG: Clp protease N-terminal domain-containing protein [Bacteroidales bacterium]
MIDTEHLLLAILKQVNSFVTKYLSELNIDYQLVRAMAEASRARYQGLTSPDRKMRMNPPSRRADRARVSNLQAYALCQPSSDTPVLDNFGNDLTRGSRGEQA